ncbi:MAG: sigma-54-dependent Fis family transcriptional regulator [Deltaproteobacteria bacterium]|nr:sigma-54-dependent Fis family transcriptional regulator [Deltaproteobacteria bacterium]
MINWEELKHIHVIRKLEEILGNWFSTDIFFIDEKGHFTNWQPGEKREFRNRLSALLAQSPAGQRQLQRLAGEATDRIVRSEKTHLINAGVIGPEKGLISRIAIDNEFLGSVMAYPVLENEVSASEKSKIAEAAKNSDLTPGDVEKTFAGTKPIRGADMDYFKQLVDLVSQEIITFHTEISRREERISALNQELGTRYRYDNMIGKSKPMQELYALLDKIKQSESTVLIQGENGTGKELIAKAVHYNSPRKEAAFVTVNCSAFNENLLDSELFGHVKGSFTGAVKDKKGLFESADKGTLFLDEIGDMSPTMQVKLLRVVQEGTFLPVGGTDMRKVDVRVLAATNKDLKEMIENGGFREDLYYRINVINVNVPPLRDRKEDIPVLVDFFLDRGCKEKGIEMKQVAKRAMEKIYDYAWPGNIRELENEIERLIVLSGDDVKINGELLSPRIKEWGEKAKVQGVRIQGKLKDALEELEKTMIREGLKRTNWNKSRLAKELGISRAGLIMKVEKYGLDKRRIARAAAEGTEA